MEFDFTTTTAKTFDEAVQGVQGERPKEIDQIIQNIINYAK